jgi:Holliday junction resolvase
MRARRTDSNHQQTVKAFRDLGCTVLDLSRVGQGCPDLLVGKHGDNILVEIKDGAKCASRTKLTADECGFHQTWKGRVAIVKNLDDVLDVVKILSTKSI